ncbi:TRAP transporter small permease [Limimaricola pyoseonensis]|uniref:TRAP transporter small permease protein n=1 Tax=Limimaricola pyoseonensis TaxID=521013 RepID=A0A1G7HUG4_9RHOB|nr:TRAP transporter small permease subunit [Limimaricola pyoseonensis]SDF04080.1 TRAP-type C4-dicarboxylate transport system, small permease component [Limimaricola pyoseonensis]
MRSILAALGACNAALRRALSGLCFGLIVFFFLAILYQILARNLAMLPQAYWTEELSRFSFQWLVLAGAALGVAADDHFVLEIVGPERRLGRALLVLRDLALAAIGLLFVVYGWEFGLSGLRRTAMVTGLPMIWIYMGFAVLGGLMLLFLAERLLAMALHGVRPGRARAGVAATTQGDG